MDSFLGAVAAEYAEGSIRESAEGQGVFEQLMKSFTSLIENPDFIHRSMGICAIGHFAQPFKKFAGKVLE